VEVDSNYHAVVKHGWVPLPCLSLLDDRQPPRSHDFDSEPSDSDDNEDDSDDDSEEEEEDEEDEEDEGKKSGSAQEDTKMGVEDASTGSSSGIVAPASQTTVFQFGGSSLSSSTSNPGPGSVFTFGGSSVSGTSSSNTVQFGAGLPLFGLNIAIPQPNIDETKKEELKPTKVKANVEEIEKDASTFYYKYDDTANEFFSPREFETFKNCINALPNGEFRTEILECIHDFDGYVGSGLPELCQWLEANGKAKSMDFALLNQANKRYDIARKDVLFP